MKTSRMSKLKGSPEPIAALNKIPILEKEIPWESREPLVNIRHHCKEVILSDHLCPFLRSTVADMLNRAYKSLPSGYNLKIGTALRTLSMQSNGWDNYYARMQAEHPEWPLSALRRATNHFFAPYDQPAPPGHCTGGAVDVSLLDPVGNIVDLIEPTTGWEAAYTWSDKISAEAKKNRMIMVEAMLGAGFSNCRDEYWHYSWGDSAWAVRSGEKTCPYGWAYAPVEVHIAEPSEVKAIHPAICTRSFDGKVIRADAEIDIPDLAAPWRVELCWAAGVPTALKIHTKAKKPETIWWRFGKEEEHPFPENSTSVPHLEDNYWVQHEPGSLMIHITPAADRIFFSNYKQPPPENTT